MQICSFLPSATEILYALGLGESVSGVTFECDFPPDAATKTVVVNTNLAEDLTSEVFHKALATLHRFEWRGVPFGAWLLKIAANAITDQAKRSQREVNFEDPPEISAKPRMEQAQDLARLFRLVNELPEDQRNVVVMRFAEEKSIREVAQQLGKSEGAVKQLQFRGLENLRVRLESEAGKPRTTPRSTQKHRKESTTTGGKNG